MSETSWIWGAIGLVLLAVEMATGTFYVFWFGVAALILGLLTWLLPGMSIALQLVLFAGLSLGALFVWRNYYKKTDPDFRIGQSQGDEIGVTGVITEAVSPTQNGRIQFAQGVMGSRDWAAVASVDIAVGAQATIVAIEGNALRVKPA